MSSQNLSRERGADDEGKLILAELDSVIESPAFLRSPVLSNLLRYLVKYRAEGHHEGPKATVVAIEALGRGSEFNGATDSYPRVMISRLRSALDTYYASVSSPVRLYLPIGSYAIELRHLERGQTATSRADGAEETATTKGAGGPHSVASGVEPTPAGGLRHGDPARIIRASLIVTLFALIAILAIWYAEKAMPMQRAEVAQAPVLVVAPAEDLRVDDLVLVQSVNMYLQDGLDRMDGLRLLDAPKGSSGGTVSKPDYRLDTTMLRIRPEGYRATFLLSRLDDQQIIWSRVVVLSLDPDHRLEQLDSIVGQVGGDYGLLVRDQISRNPDDYTVGYPCFAQFNRLRHARDGKGRAAVNKCLYRAMALEPDNPIWPGALSLTSFALAQRTDSILVRRAILIEARDLGHRAYTASPNSAAGLFALARVRYFAGQCDDAARLGRAAIAANRNNPDVVGYVGLFELGCGNADIGESNLRRSMSLDDTPSRFGGVALAFLLAERGDVAEAEIILDAAPQPLGLEPQFRLVRVMIAGKRGKLAEAEQLWTSLVEETGAPPGAAPETVLRRFLVSPVVLALAAKALRDTGVVKDARST